MSVISIHRGVEGCGGGLRGSDRQRRNPTNGRQGKRPAFVTAQVVGWVGYFEHSTTPPRWRLRHFLKRFQRPARRRPRWSGRFRS